MVRKIVISLVLFVFPSDCSDSRIVQVSGQSSSSATSTSQTVTANPSSSLAAIRILTNALQGESSPERRANIGESISKLLGTDSQEFLTQLREFRKSLDEVNKRLKDTSDNAFFSPNIALGDRIFKMYRGILVQSTGCSLMTILEHLEREFFKMRWGRVVVEGIEDGVWKSRKLQELARVNEDLIAASWVSFLSEMIFELGFLERYVEEGQKHNLEAERAITGRDSYPFMRSVSDEPNLARINEKKKFGELLQTKITTLRTLFFFLQEAAIDKQIGRAYQNIYAQELLPKATSSDDTQSTKRRRQN